MNATLVDSNVLLDVFTEDEVCVLASRSRRVVPDSARAADGNRQLLSVFRNRQGRRVMLVIGEQHLRSLAGRRIYELAFRKDLELLSYYERIRGGESTRVKLTASWSSADPSKPSLIFAQNHAKPTVVFDGDVVLPRVSIRDTRKVATFDAKEAPTLSFTRPLAHVPGKSLVLDFVTDGGTNWRHWAWSVDAVTSFKPGVVQPFGASCWPSPHGPQTLGVVRGSLRPGMHLSANTATPPDPIGAFFMIGQSRDKAFGVLPLPLRIADPLCNLMVSPDVMTPTLWYRGKSKRADGWTVAEVATPYLNSLYGSTLHFQFLFLHRQGANVLLKTSNAVAATFTKRAPDLGVSLIASLDKTATGGRVFLDFTPVIQLSAR